MATRASVLRDRERNPVAPGGDRAHPRCMTDATRDERPTQDAAPGDDETLLPDDAPESGPLTPADDPVADDDESTVGGPP